MVLKYLFYFISRFVKKCNNLGGVDEFCNIAACGFIGLSIVVSIVDVNNIVSIFFLRNKCLIHVTSKVMIISTLLSFTLCYIYFVHKNRGNVLYEEIHNSSSSSKYIYGIVCFVYTLTAFSLWFFTNDIIREITTGDGGALAAKFVNKYKIARW